MDRIYGSLLHPSDLYPPCPYGPTTLVSIFGPNIKQQKCQLFRWVRESFTSQICHGWPIINVLSNSAGSFFPQPIVAICCFFPQNWCCSSCQSKHPLLDGFVKGIVLPFWGWVLPRASPFNKLINRVSLVDISVKSLRSKWFDRWIEEGS